MHFTKNETNVFLSVLNTPDQYVIYHNNPEYVWTNSVNGLHEGFNDV